jgi:putative redox protein
MSDAAAIRTVSVGESGLGPYGQIVVSGRHVFGADEAESAGGKDTGPDPYDLLCSALGCCTAMTVRMYANRKQWPLSRISVTVTHAKVDGAPPAPGPAKAKVDLFTRLVLLEGGLDAEQRARLLEIANKCPVHETLTRGAKVETRLGETG